jgi:hypothetical protein
MTSTCSWYINDEMIDVDSDTISNRHVLRYSIERERERDLTLTLHILNDCTFFGMTSVRNFNDHRDQNDDTLSFFRW